MPKITVPAHIMKKYKADKQAQIKKNQEQRQAIAEADALALQEQRKEQEAKQRQKLQKRISESTAASDALNSEIAELKDEGYASSLQLANQRIQNRVDCLTLDCDHYRKEIKRFEEREFNTGFLKDEVESIETELSELNIDLKVSTMSTEGVNHANS